MSTMPNRDLSFENQVTLFLARPISERGQEWLDERCPEGDDHTYWGHALVVEQRHAAESASMLCGIDPPNFQVDTYRLTSGGQFYGDLEWIYLVTAEVVDGKLTWLVEVRGSTLPA